MLLTLSLIGMIMQCAGWSTMALLDTNKVWRVVDAVLAAFCGLCVPFGILNIINNADANTFSSLFDFFVGIWIVALAVIKFIYPSIRNR